jgi:Sodium/hydrogen exchanger family
MLAFIFDSADTGVLEFLRAHVASLSPLSRAMVALAAILVVPPICRRVKLPPVVGLLAAGILLGPSFSISSERSVRPRISWQMWASCC